MRHATDFLAGVSEADTPFHQNLCGEAFFFTQQTKQQVLRTNMLVGEALGFLPAYASTRLDSLLRGRSIEVEVFSRTVTWASTCFRIDATDA